jgi:hypothetical protein
MREKPAQSAFEGKNGSWAEQRIRGCRDVVRVCATFVTVCAVLAPIAGFQHGGGGGMDREDRIGWRKMNQMLQIHAMTHMTQGMSVSDKVKSMQRMHGEVNALASHRRDGPLLDIETSAGLSERITKGNIFVRNGTIYSNPLPLTRAYLSNLSIADLRTLGAQLRVCGLGEGGVGVGKRRQLEERLLAVCNSSKPLNERLMCLSRGPLRAILLKLGLRTEFVHPTKANMVHRIVSADRFKYATTAELRALMRMKDKNEAQHAVTRRSMLLKMRVHHDMDQFLKALVDFQTMTTGQLFEKLQQRDATPARMRVNTHGVIVGFVSNCTQAEWLRNLGCTTARDVKKADWVYGMLLCTHPVVTASLVDEEILQRLRQMDKTCDYAVKQIAHSVRQSLCHARARAQYRHSNSDGTWTITTAAGERLRVGCGVDMLKRVDKKRSSYLAILASRVHVATRGNKISHSHTTAPCLLCDKRFRPPRVQDEETAKRRDTLETRLKKSEAILQVSRTGRRKSRVGHVGNVTDSESVNISKSCDHHVGNVTDSESVHVNVDQSPVVKDNLLAGTTPEARQIFDRALNLLRSLSPPKGKSSKGRWSRRQAEAVCKSMVCMYLSICMSSCMCVRMSGLRGRQRLCVRAWRVYFFMYLCVCL